MTPDAYFKLARWGLPHPKTHRLEDIVEQSHPTRCFFIRYKSGSPLSTFATSNHLRQEFDRYRELIHDGQITQIEDGVRSDYGGCVVSRHNTIYLEMVAGHLSGLLRHGWCQRRIYSDATKTFAAKVSQTQKVRQSLKGNSIQASTRIPEKCIEQTLLQLKRLLAPGTRSILYEFIIDRRAWNVVFVDYKPYEWELDFTTLFGPSHNFGKPLLQVRCAQPNHFQGSFELAALPEVTPSTVLHVGNNAVLSHYVTYSLTTGICGIVP